MNKATKQPTIRIATGFLVSETEIGTAGHCVYDQEYERLVGVEVYLGYSDKGYDEIRYGDLVTVPSAYVDGQTEDDLAVIRLDEPFQETVTPINWINTPDQMELLEIKVPGFPSDLSVGKIMYEGSQQHVKVNLASSHGMIQYLVDTYGGMYLKYPSKH
jgi:V8-like Glu-specific endopeptidase